MVSNNDIPKTGVTQGDIHKEIAIRNQKIIIILIIEHTTDTQKGIMNITQIDMG